MDPKVIQTIMEMLDDRKYKVLDSSESDTITAIHTVTNEEIKVFFIFDDKVGVKHINVIIEQINNKKCIIVFKNNMTYFAKQALEEYKNIEIFDSDSLKFNITHHHLVPKHELVDKKVKEQLLQKYRIGERNLPVILRSDPISKYYGAKTGDLFEITRINDNNFGHSVTYRVVN